MKGNVNPQQATKFLKTKVVAAKTKGEVNVS
jgi:hypothetical protein